MKKSQYFRLPGNKGMTLVELAIGLLLSGIIISASLSLYLTQHKQFMVQGEINDMQSSVLAASAELVSKIRMAGYQMPVELRSIRGCNSNPDSITLSYSSTDLNGVKLERDMAAPSDPLFCDGHNLSALNDYELVYISDPILKQGEYFQVSAVDYGSSTIYHNAYVFTHAYPAGSKILKIMKFKYYIDRSDTSHPNLMYQMNNDAPSVFAENISDLQFKYVVPAMGIVDTPPSDLRIREVLISITARSNEPDQDSENQYRSRTLTTRANVRNFGALAE